MAAHLTRDTDGASPPSRNEVLLLEAVDWLRLQLDATRRFADLAGDFWNQAHNTIGFLDEHAELLAETDAEFVKTQITLLIEDYDKAMGGK